MSYPGGYQMVDISDVTLNSVSAVTVTNSKNAEILRSTRKPVHFHGAKLGANTVSGIATVVSDTGALDGKVYSIVSAQAKFMVSTNDNKITFTPAGA